MSFLKYECSMAPCAKKDPHNHSCLLKNGNEAWPLHKDDPHNRLHIYRSPCTKQNNMPIILESRPNEESHSRRHIEIILYPAI